MANASEIKNSTTVYNIYLKGGASIKNVTEEQYNKVKQLQKTNSKATAIELTTEGKTNDAHMVSHAQILIGDILVIEKLEMLAPVLSASQATGLIK